MRDPSTQNGEDPKEKAENDVDDEVVDAAAIPEEVVESADETPLAEEDVEAVPEAQEEAPVEDAPATETPAEEAPVEEASAAEEPADQPDGEVEDNVVELPEPPEVVIELTPEEILQKRLDEANVRLRTVSKAYTDLQSENKSFRERIESQAKFKRERQAFELARGFFDPVQNLKRSIGQGVEDPAGLLSGLEMVLKQFMGAMEKLGLQEIPGVGSDFDPTVHEALGVTPVLEPEQDGKVLIVYSDGYTVNGKVLVASQVVIGKYQENQGEA